MLNGARKNLSNLQFNPNNYLCDTIQEAVSKIVDRVQWQGFPRFESGAYTVVREHFKLWDNAAIGR